MIALLARCAVMMALAALCVLAALGQYDRPPPVPLIRADYPVCVTVKPAPLLRGPKSRIDYRTGERFNDNGET